MEPTHLPELKASASRKSRDWAKHGLRTLFEYGQRCGFDVLPRHFYSEVPNISELRRNRRWQRPYSLAGVRGVDVEDQLRWLREVIPTELAAILPALELQQNAAKANGAVGYGPVECDLLYCIVRTRKPRRIVQIGAGVSTWVASKAAEDSGQQLDITCIDPFPTDFLLNLHEKGKIDLIHAPVQDVPTDILIDLQPGDILFVDSTHTVSVGSDVNYVILEVLPRLPKGVLIHFHDITIPYDYMPYVLSSDLFFWTESVLLHAYLVDNPRVEIRLGCAMLHDKALSEAQTIIPTYGSPAHMERGLAEGNDGVFPSSMWLEVIGDPVGIGS